MLLIAVALPLVMLIASPVLAIMAQRKGPAPAAAHAELLARQIEREWNAVTPLPLRFIGGDEDIAFGVIVYAAGRPRALPGLPGPGEAVLRQSGMVLVCFAEDAECKRKVSVRAERVQGSRTVASTIQRNFWRIPGKPQRYTIVVVPPRP